MIPSPTVLQLLTQLRTDLLINSLLVIQQKADLHTNPLLGNQSKVDPHTNHLPGNQLKADPHTNHLPGNQLKTGHHTNPLQGTQLITDHHTVQETLWRTGHHINPLQGSQLKIDPITLRVNRHHQDHQHLHHKKFLGLKDLQEDSILRLHQIQGLMRIKTWLQDHYLQDHPHQDLNHKVVTKLITLIKQDILKETTIMLNNLPEVPNLQGDLLLMEDLLCDKHLARS